MAGADGNLYFTENAGAGRIGQITTLGAITEFSAGLTARLWAMGHRKRLGRQHLVHRERGESGRATHRRTRRHHGSGDAGFAGALPVAGDAIARSKRRADPPSGDAPGVRQVGDDRHGLRRGPRAAPGNRRLPPALRRLDGARGDDDRRHPGRAQADECATRGRQAADREVLGRLVQVPPDARQAVHHRAHADGAAELREVAPGSCLRRRRTSRACASSGGKTTTVAS